MALNLRRLNVITLPLVLHIDLQTFLSKSIYLNKNQKERHTQLSLSLLIL